MFAIKNKKVHLSIYRSATRLKIGGFFVFFFLFFQVVAAAPGVPLLLHHQGRLLDASGNLLGGSSGTNYCFRFSLYDDAIVGGPDTRLWPSVTPSTMTVEVTSGILSVNIGDIAAGGNLLDIDFNATDELYLNVEVADSIAGSCAGVSVFETLGPRYRVTASGYAINSKTVGGFTPSQTATGNEVPVLTSGTLILGSASAGLRSQGTNALILQSGVTGDLQFFSSLNRMTAAGNLILNGSVTTAGLTLSAGGSVVTNGAGSLTIGNGSLTSLIVSTDGTGDSEVVLPNGAIASNEILLCCRRNNKRWSYSHWYRRSYTRYTTHCFRYDRSNCFKLWS
ncbi:MAG: hypothetical protein MUD00_03600 [Candidatus Pacebacteria bacterium]|nr:hypothetical protein [Candidatus Paceibacterota bacterium]